MESHHHESDKIADHDHSEAAGEEYKCKEGHPLFRIHTKCYLKTHDKVDILCHKCHFGLACAKSFLKCLECEYY